MADGPKAKAKGGTGKKKKVKIQPQLVVPEVHPAEISEDAMGTRTFSGFTPTFTGSFTEKEKKLALWVFGTFSVEDNRRKTFHVKFTESGASSATIFVFTAVKNTNTSSIDVHKVGAPTATLPDGTAADAIKARLTPRNIKVIGTWKSKERRAVLAALGDCTDEELDKMKDLKIDRGSSTPSGSTDASVVGAHYDQTAHTIEVFDATFELSISSTGHPNGTLMALGNDPAGVLPGAAHAVVHEAGHVLAFGEKRAADLKEEETFQALKKESQNMKANWSAFYTDKLEEDKEKGREFSYRTSGKPSTEPDKTNFETDKKALDDAFDAWNKAGKKLDALTQSKVMEDFGKEAKKQVPVTPYSLEEKDNASDEEARRAALEEFFAESFSLFHWDPDWLEANREPVFKFFDGKKHL